MTVVFLSGSRSIRRLPEEVCVYLDTIVRDRTQVLVGDANGADKAFQQFLATRSYESVVVYCSGSGCRNNVGGWPEQHIEVDPGLKGREFYAVKDRRMAEEADSGWVLWDGESFGSIQNVIELLKRGKESRLYLSLQKTIYTVASWDDVSVLLEKCSPSIRSFFHSEFDLPQSKSDSDSEAATQMTFEF
jgi:hypothetical protein